MSDESSSKPVAIQSPRLRPQGSDGALAASSYNQRERDIPPRSQYGTPPPNIPPRFTSSSSSVPSELAGAARFPSPRNGGTPNRGDQTPTKQQVKTPDREAANTPFENLDDLSDGEKAKVLRKHLVSKEERAGGKKSPASAEDVAAAGESSGASRLAPDRLSIPDQVSRRSSSSSVARLRREDTELFPLPYNAPGGDIT
jgi:proton-coupled amino acid transporter